MKRINLNQTTSEREFIHKELLLFFLITILPSVVLCQWKRIAVFPQYVSTVYFKDSSTLPMDGFVSIGLGIGNSVPQKLFHTYDGGNSWQQVTLPLGNTGLYPEPNRFTFKNLMEGWFSDPVGYDVFLTLDGGTTWSITKYFGSWSVFYVPKTDQLISTGVPMAGTSATNGIAFSDSIHGIITAINTSNNSNKAIFTTDGGITWSQSNLHAEQYQPLAIKDTKIFYALTEQNDNFGSDDVGSLWRTDDGGLNWNKIYRYRIHDNLQAVTGTLQYGLGRIFFQTTPDGSEGIMMSEDSGYTFYSICGPTNFDDSYFYVRDSFIYAGDKQGGLWLNTTGIGSNSTPQLSLTKMIAPALLGCQKFDSLISFTFFDSCANTQAKLVSASINGSPNFSFTSPSAIPRIIHRNDSLIISYNPQTSQADTAQLHLRFHLGWKDFDTTIQLLGAGRILKENVKIIPSLSQSSAWAGTITDLYVMPDKAISGRGLQSISFDLNYNGDLLDESSRVFSTSIPGAVITVGTESPSTQTRHGASLPVTITGANLTLDPKLPIADIKFQAMVTDTTSTQITMSNLKLNGGDPNYANCVLSADSANTNFSLIPACGDSILREYLRIGKVPDIISIRPNPAQDELEIDLRSAVKQDALVEIFDALGAKVFSDVRNITIGTNIIHLDTKGLSGGMYLVRVGGASQSFVKVQ